VPGVDLPVSYLTNNGVDPNVLFEVEGSPFEAAVGNRYYPLLPVYHSMDGECVTRFHYEWRERISILWSRLKGLQNKWVPIATPEGKGNYIFSVRFLWSGDIWLVREKSQLGQFAVRRMLNKCPFSPGEEKKRRISAPRSFTEVIMSGRNMVDETGVAEVIGIVFSETGFTVKGREEELGAFQTENEAIAAVADELRKRNEGKWHNGKDLDSYSGEPEYPPTLRCPDCECALLKPTGLKSWRDLRNKWQCPKCRKEYTVKDRMTHPIIELASAEFTRKAIAAGFTEAQAELLLSMDRNR
jgi:hypothetical protein